ncbi:YqaJ viral recombinase family protein [Fusobacterium perfoetens]|uniref:YqaJ viral recombinase family protein n=1 Tax=Fusobacterium perfoetens TaxID=852 RepID=UPI001F490CFD|nr:YqaJ viral recombinase family protein [Fusobacterium perfoetens]MCF2611793.1 YqaJ viral recombinase family protein [Fusobacterium perfoetens]
MTLKELQQKAKSMGLRGFWKLKKVELEKFIEENTLHNSEVLFAGECSGDGEWLEHRRIGATDTAVLICDNAYRNRLLDRPDKYTSPFLMYEERKGRYKREISFTSQVAMEFGHFAEDFIIAHLPVLFEKEFGIKVQATRKGNQVVANKKYPLWSCTPDSWVKIEGEWYPVELKTGNSYTAYEWEREEVPNKYYAQVQQQLAVLGKEKGFLIGFVDNRFTRLYEIERNDKLISQAYEITRQFQYCLDNNIEPELNGCEAECEYLKQEFQGFGNKYENIPGMDINEKDLQYYLDLEQTKREISKETKEIEKDMKTLICVIQNKMLDLETENLVINGSYLATWKIDARGAKRFALKELKENQKIKIA